MSENNKNISRPIIEISSKKGGFQDRSKSGGNVTSTTVKPPITKPSK